VAGRRRQRKGGAGARRGGAGGRGKGGAGLRAAAARAGRGTPRPGVTLFPAGRDPPRSAPDPRSDPPWGPARLRAVDPPAPVPCRSRPPRKGAAPRPGRRAAGAL